MVIKVAITTNYTRVLKKVDKTHARIIANIILLFYRPRAISFRKLAQV